MGCGHRTANLYRAPRCHPVSKRRRGTPSHQPARDAGAPVPCAPRMLLALFLLDAAAGLYLFLPLVGRRNAGVKFYRLILLIGGVLALCAAIAHAMASRRDLAYADSA